MRGHTKTLITEPQKKSREKAHPQSLMKEKDSKGSWQGISGSLSYPDWPLKSMLFAIENSTANRFPLANDTEADSARDPGRVRKGAHC